MKIKFDIGNYLDKLLALLHITSQAGGLEISDSTLRFVYRRGGIWQMANIRLAPGIMEGGKIKDYGKFVDALRELRAAVAKDFDQHKKITIIVSLSSINIYSQVFSLPIIEGENLEKAIQLNIQMVSPVESAQAYSGWQTVGRDQGALRLEILSAFVDRQIVDEITKGLFEAGFVAMAIESRALALARLVRDAGAGFDPAGYYIVFGIDGSGLDFLIMRGGQLYFEYFNSWKDLMDEKGQITMTAFKAAVSRSLHQVLNFYSQHWPEVVTQVIVSAPSLKDEASQVIRENFSLNVIDLKLNLAQSIPPEWYIALGCGYRGFRSRRKDKDISLLGVDAEEAYRREQILAFAKFWRILMPSGMGLLTLSFLLANLFLGQTKTVIESQMALNLSDAQVKEIAALSAHAAQFNDSVKFIAAIENSGAGRGVLLKKVNDYAEANGVTLTRFYYQSSDSPLAIAGFSKEQAQVIAFKQALENDGAFAKIDLPIVNIKITNAGITFSLSAALK